jgi:hypothetical protein
MGEVACRVLNSLCASISRQAHDNYVFQGMTLPLPPFLSVLPIPLAMDRLLANLLVESRRAEETKTKADSTDGRDDLARPIAKRLSDILRRRVGQGLDPESELTSTTDLRRIAGNGLVAFTDRYCGGVVAWAMDPVPVTEDVESDHLVIRCVVCTKDGFLIDNRNLELSSPGPESTGLAATTPWCLRRLDWVAGILCFSTSKGLYFHRVFASNSDPGESSDTESDDEMPTVESKESCGKAVTLPIPTPHRTFTPLSFALRNRSTRGPLVQCDMLVFADVRDDSLTLLAPVRQDGGLNPQIVSRLRQGNHVVQQQIPIPHPPASNVVASILSAGNGMISLVSVVCIDTQSSVLPEEGTSDWPLELSTLRTFLFGRHTTPLQLFPHCSDPNPKPLPFFQLLEYEASAPHLQTESENERMRRQPLKLLPHLPDTPVVDQEHDLSPSLLLSKEVARRRFAIVRCEGDGSLISVAECNSQGHPGSSVSEWTVLLADDAFAVRRSFSGFSNGAMRRFIFEPNSAPTRQRGNEWMLRENSRRFNAGVVVLGSASLPGSSTALWFVGNHHLSSTANAVPASQGPQSHRKGDGSDEGAYTPLWTGRTFASDVLLSSHNASSRMRKVMDLRFESADVLPHVEGLTEPAQLVKGISTGSSSTSEFVTLSQMKELLRVQKEELLSEFRQLLTQARATQGPLSTEPPVGVSVGVQCPE